MPLDLEEQEQVAELKAWWKQHGNLIVAAVLACAIAFAGWQGWRWYQASQAAQAAGLYEALAKAAQAGDAKALRDAGGSLIESYPRTLYAAMGALVAARFHFDRNDFKAAKTQLEWVVERSPADDFKDLARLRLAAILLDEKAYDEALKVLDAKHAPAYDAQFAALRGDVLVAKNQPAEARAAYQLAIEKAAKDQGTFRDSVRMRLEALGGLNVVRGLLLATVIALSACSGPSGPQPAELTAIKRPLPVRTLWSTNVGSGERFTFFPVHAGDAVYAAARSGTVTRLAARTGEVRWRTNLELQLSGGVGTDGKLVVVASEEGEVVALDAEKGEVKWRARASSEVLAPPALGGGLVLVRSMDNRVFAFGAEDGKRRWVYQRAPTSLVVRAPAGITILEDMAYAGFPGGKLAALALANGALRWEATVAAPKGATELERVADVIGEPAAHGREVCAAAYRTRVSCFDAQSGRPLWSREVAALSGVSLDARYAFVSDERGAVHAFDRSNGQSLWKQDALAYRGLTTPLPRAEAVVVGDFQGYVHVLARESGAFLARKETDGAMLRSGPVPLGGAVLVQTEGGGLYAFGP